MTKAATTTRMSVDDRRALLLAAAERVVVRDGFSALTTRSVTAEAGMTLGHFHYCFHSKDELLSHLVTRTTAALSDRGVAAIERASTPSETIEGAVRRLWASLTVDPQRLLVLYELTTHVVRDASLDLAGEQYQGYQRSAEVFVEALAEAADSRWVVPPVVVARLLVGTLDGLGLRWLADRDDLAMDEVLQVLTLQLQALLAPAD